MEQAVTVAEAPGPTVETAEVQSLPEGSPAAEPGEERLEVNQVTTAESQKEAAQKESEVALIRAELESLKKAVETKAGSDDLEELRASLESLQKALSEDLDRRQREVQDSQATLRQAIGQTEQELVALHKSVDNIQSVVRPETRRRGVDPSTIPPLVLQQTYEAILTAIFREMLRRHGAAAAERVKVITDYVRRASSGMEFFSLVGNDRIAVIGLADALRRRLVSAHQIHTTFNEFSKQLLAEVPGYQAPNLKDLADVGSMGYTVSEVQRIVDQVIDIEKNQARLATRFDMLEELERRVNEVVINVESLDKSLSEKIDKFEEKTSATIAQATSSMVEAQVSALTRQLSATEERLRRLEASVAKPAAKAPAKPRAKRQAS